MHVLKSLFENAASAGDYPAIKRSAVSERGDLAVYVRLGGVVQKVEFFLFI
ncbi:unnamed protein product [Brassica oleracea var. botrytis]